MYMWKIISCLVYIFVMRWWGYYVSVRPSEILVSVMSQARVVVCFDMIVRLIWNDQYNQKMNWFRFWHWSRQRQGHMSEIVFLQELPFWSEYQTDTLVLRRTRLVSSTRCSTVFQHWTQIKCVSSLLSSFHFLLKRFPVKINTGNETVSWSHHMQSYLCSSLSIN